MASLPAVFVELKATTSQFTSQFDAAKKTVHDFSSQSTSGLQKLEQVGKVAFIGLAGAATVFGGIAVKAALDGQQAHAQLVNAVQNSGTAFESVGGKVDEMSGRFAKLGYANDQVEEAMTRLVTASGNTKTAMDNMGLAADLARARHIGLEEASGALGKVLAGNMRGMQAFGLSTKDAGGNLLTTAQAVAELNDRFGGAAQANANTYAGKLQALNAEWHNMTEKIGNALLPVLAEAAGAVANVVGWLDKHREVAGALAGVIGGPLVAAMTIYAAKQAATFAGNVIQAIGGVTRAMFGLAAGEEAAAGAATGLGAAEIAATGGLAAVGIIVGGIAAHFLGHASATKQAATAATGAAASMSGLVDAEGNLGDETDGTSKSLKAQADLFKQLNNDVGAQQSEILTLIGDQNAVNTATEKLKNSTGANSEMTKQAAQHTKDLADAQRGEKDAENSVTDALDRQTVAKKKLDDLMKPQTVKNVVSAQDDWQAAQDRVGKASEALTDKQKDLTDALVKFGPTSKEAQQAQWDFNAAVREGHDATAAADQALQGLADTYRPTIGTTIEIAGATGDLTAATKAVTDAQDKQKDARTKLNDVLADRGAIVAAAADAKNAADSTFSWWQATVNQRVDWDKLMASMAANPELRAQFVATLKGMRDNAPKGTDLKPINDLLDRFAAPVAPNSLLSLLSQKQILSIAGDTGNITLGATSRPSTPAPASATFPASWFPPGDPVKRAAGGPVYPGATYMVGEDGPEYLRMGSMGGTVIPSAGGVTVNAVINVNGATGDMRAIAVAVRDELIKLGRRNGTVGLN